MARDRSGQGGFTLVELLVTLVIFGVVGGIVTSSTITALRSASASESRIDALQELEIAMQRVTRDLRAADPLELVTDEYGDALGAEITRGDDTFPVRYRLVHEGGVKQLVLEDSGRTLITALDNGSDVLPPADPEDEGEEDDEGDEGDDDAVAEGDPIFRYLDRFGAEIECDDDCAAAYTETAQVQIRFVRLIPNSLPAIVETRVSVRNLRHGSEP